MGLPCTPHDLRHSHVALLIADGTYPKTIQARLGHSSIRVTLDTYGHLFDGMDEAAAPALDASARGGWCGVGPRGQRRDCRPRPLTWAFMVEVIGFEPTTSSVRGKRSSGLSYTPKWETEFTFPRRLGLHP